MHASNEYSAEWFALFLGTSPPPGLELEIAFIERQLPQPSYERIVDLCCGTGRHARLLAALGYDVLGIDSNRVALATARDSQQPRAQYLELDMRRLADVPGEFDAVLNLWQSFGHFDEATNAAILGLISSKLRSGGRFIIDLYHREFFERRQGMRTFERGGQNVAESKSMVGNRLTVRLQYDTTSASDVYEWQVYTPSELLELAARHDLRCMVACSEFREEVPPTAEQPRMQFVFERS
ncbi:MAG: class I SAM-dependent methyltransferase [Anaerolineae bacterium]|nr:class I SAM-dependent methyltransferase [Gemmatimonadaceae bacterium]